MSVMEWWIVCWDARSRNWQIVSADTDLAYEADQICIQASPVVAIYGEFHVRGFGHWMHEGSPVFHIHS